MKTLLEAFEPVLRALRLSGDPDMAQDIQERVSLVEKGLQHSGMPRWAAREIDYLKSFLSHPKGLRDYVPGGLDRAAWTRTLEEAENGLDGFLGDQKPVGGT